MNRLRAACSSRLQPALLLLALLLPAAGALGKEVQAPGRERCLGAAPLAVAAGQSLSGRAAAAPARWMQRPAAGPAFFMNAPGAGFGHPDIDLREALPSVPPAPSDGPQLRIPALRPAARPAPRPLPANALIRASAPRIPTSGLCAEIHRLRGPPVLA